MTESTEQRSEPETSTIVVDGQRIERVYAPASGSEVAEILATANSLGQAIIPFGGGTLLGLGNPPDRAEAALCTRALNRVLAHEPADLTLTVEAGASLAQVQAVLGEAGQWLPIEGPLPADTTIGGLIATAFTSPRKLGSDGLRDLLVGISIAHPTGAISKAGGTVVKNVTGFDMMRLYHGSLGTLGVILSANFKVLPRPRAEATWRGSFVSLDEALAAGTKLLGLRGRPVALEIVSNLDAEWTLLARYEGREGTVRLMTDETAAAIGSPESLAEGEASAELWQGMVDRNTSGRVHDRVLIRAATRPRDTPALAKAASGLLDSMSGSTVQISPGLGRVDITIAVANVAPESRDTILNPLDAVSTSVVIYDAPVEWKRERDIWGATPDTLDVMRSLKNEFDPKRVLNPGRFAGSI